MYRRNVAGQFLTFELLSASDGSPITSGTVNGFRVRDNGAQEAVGGQIDHKGGGQWALAMSAGDTDAESIGFYFTHASAVPVNIHIVTVAFDPTNAASLGLGRLDTSIGSRASGTAVATVDAIVNAINAKTSNLPDDPADQSEVAALIGGLNDLTAAQILAAGDIDGFTVEQTLKLMLAIAVGKLSGAATDTNRFRAADDTKDRVISTVDAFGNRTEVVLDALG